MRNRLTDRIAKTASLVEDLDNVASEIEQINPRLALELDRISDVLEGKTALFGIGKPNSPDPLKKDKDALKMRVKSELAKYPEKVIVKEGMKDEIKSPTLDQALTLTKKNGDYMSLWMEGTGSAPEFGPPEPGRVTYQFEINSTNKSLNQEVRKLNKKGVEVIPQAIKIFMSK